VLTHPTIDQLHQLGLAGMARAFAELEANPESAALSHAEWLALLLDREATDCATKRQSKTSIIAPREASIAPCSRP
jgi:hypothetical protein